MSDIVTRAYEELDKRYNRLVALNASSLCTRCGLCADACHFYVASGDPELSPAAKTERVRSVYKGQHDWLARIFPRFTGARNLDEDELDAWVDAAFRYCTMCERCTVNCPMGVDTPVVMAAARGTLTAVGKAPEILVQLADAEIAREASMDIIKDLFREQIGFLEEELREETGDPEASIPIEKEGADMLYVALSGAHTILPAAKIFHRAGASWTLSLFEASNYAIFLGDTEKAKAIAKRIIDEALRLGVREVVITECGHAVFSYRWGVPTWFGELPFRIRSLVELIHEYIRDGKIQLDPGANPEPITFHDSCNLARKSGLLEQPREILGAATENFREMSANREQAFCCGAGSGLVAVEEWRDTRIQAGQPKAEQIRETGASIVVTSCDNCRHQIGDLSEHYGLGIEVKNLAEITANALS